MKKRLFTSILSVLLLIVLSVFGFAGCNPTEEKKISLNETAKELVVGESFTLTATTTPADAEVIWSTSDEAIATVEDGTVTAISVGTAIVTAKNDTATATCEITVKAAPVVETKKYTVVFKNGDSQLKSVEVEEGETVSYNGVVPSKADTEQYAYVFSGWALSVDGEEVDISTITINENKTFYAVFTQTVRSYNVTWNIDGATTSEAFDYGATPEYKGTTPTKPTVGFTSYTFKGWAATVSGEVLETLPAVTGDVTYYAVFEEVTAQSKFTVTWKNGETELEKDVDVEYEAMPTYNSATPVKESTTESDFVFVGWATSVDGAKLDVLPEVTADATYYAVFEETARKYTITWIVEGIESTSEIAYGSVPAYEGTPVKADSEICSFKFVGWALTEDGEAEETLPTVVGEATYYAVFEVDQIFESPKFLGGAVQYSANSEEVFFPEGLLSEGVTLVKAVWKKTPLDRVTVYENGAWAHDLITLTEEELKGNLIGVRTLEVELSNESKYSVDMQVYAGIIDELNDFPVFFNNTAVANEAENAADFPMVAPDTYGYYIITKDLGTGSEELALTQTALTNYQKTNGFNGVLDGQGHTLRFKLMSGGLVGLVLGNAVIKNLAVVYEDASFISQAEGGGYGVFGYITNGSPEIRNCYIERVNTVDSRSSVLGLMARPNAKLILRNTVVYGFCVQNDATWWSNTWICEASENAYAIGIREGRDTQQQMTNFTKVFVDTYEDGSREVLLSEIEDASGFDDNYWYKENGKLIWKGFEIATITWVKGEETTVETVTKGDYTKYTQTLPEDTITETEIVKYYWALSEDGEEVGFGKVYQVNADVTYYMVIDRATRYYTVTWNIDGVETTTDYEFNATAAHDAPEKAEDDYYTYEFKGWSLSEDGEIVELGTVTADGITYYAVFEKTAKISFITVNEPILYSSADDQVFFPAELNLTLDETVIVKSADSATVYYENGAWVKNFDLTDEQIKSNAIGSVAVAIEKGTDCYVATVKSYAGVIDELSDFPAFFNNTAVPSEFDANQTAVAPNVYGYYIVTKNLGTGSEELAFTQTEATDYNAANGFNGVLDGQGHKLQFTLTSGGLVGMILGNATIKNLAVVFTDNTSTHYGVFGYRAGGHTVIENCYIERVNNPYTRTTIYGIIACTNKNLELRNTVVNGGTMSNTADWYSNMYISTSSTNAFLIYARLDKNANTWGISANFTEIVDGGVLASDLSSMDTNIWNTASNRISFKSAADMTFSSIIKVAL